MVSAAHKDGGRLALLRTTNPARFWGPLEKTRRATCGRSFFRTSDMKMMALPRTLLHRDTELMQIQPTGESVPVGLFRPLEMDPDPDLLKCG